MHCGIGDMMVTCAISEALLTDIESCYDTSLFSGVGTIDIDIRFSPRHLGGGLRTHYLGIHGSTLVDIVVCTMMSVLSLYIVLYQITHDLREGVSRYVSSFVSLCM